MKYLIVIIISILAVGAGVGIAFLMDDSGDGGDDVEVIVDDSKTEFVASEGEAVDCGEIVFDKDRMYTPEGGEEAVLASTDEQGRVAIKCFDKSFRACSPAVVTYGLPQYMVSVVRILGLDGGRCAMEGELAEFYWGDEFVGPKMICSYALGDESYFLLEDDNWANCKGELKELLIQLEKELNS